MTTIALQETLGQEGTLRRLRGDDRGAVLLTGLCMSCFLIGSLWFLMGIGDAIVFRDSMQEAADHGAFTSAVIHARGMNFIAACNLVLLGMIAIHIILGLIHDILLAYCILFAVETFGAACVPYPPAYAAYHAYASAMKPIASTIHDVEDVAAAGYPMVGSAKGFMIGNYYGERRARKRGQDNTTNVFVMSSSMTPGSIDPALMAAFERLTGPAASAVRVTTAGLRKGLPVEGKRFSVLCRKIGPMAIANMAALTGLGDILGMGGVLGMVMGWIGSGVERRYCNDLSSGAPISPPAMLAQGNGAINAGNAAAQGAALILAMGGPAAAAIPEPMPPEGVPVSTIPPPTPGGGGTDCRGGSPQGDPGLDAWWGCEGPLLPWGGTVNGSSWNQVWSVNEMPEYRDAQQNKVALAKRVSEGKYGQVSTAVAPSYFAGAEFYYDCRQFWYDDACNGTDIDDNAGYSVQWRARLKRLDFPPVAALLQTYGGGYVAALQGFVEFQDWVRTSGRDASGRIDPLSVATMNDTAAAFYTNYVDESARDLLERGGRVVDPSMNGSYH